MVELHHFDIQSTEQKSHCLLPTSDSGGLGLFFKKNASPGGLFGPQVSVLPRDGRRWSIYTQEVVVGELKIVISEQQLWNHWCCFSGRWRSPALPCAAVRWNGWGSSGGDPRGLLQRTSLLAPPVTGPVPGAVSLRLGDGPCCPPSSHRSSQESPWPTRPVRLFS